MIILVIDANILFCGVSPNDLRKWGEGGKYDADYNRPHEEDLNKIYDYRMAYDS